MASGMAKSDELAQALLIEALTRHDVHLHRVSSATVNRLTEGFDNRTADMLRQLEERLDGLQPAELLALARGRYHTARLKGIKALIDDWAKAVTSELVTGFKTRAAELAGFEVDYMASLIGQVVESAPAVATTGAAVYKAAAATPVLGEFVEQMLADIPANARKRIESTIRQGITDGRTNGEIIKAIRGTPALKYKDGLLQKSRRDLDAIVRTGINHVSASAYNDTYEALGVEEVMDSSTLDGRTTVYCGSIDGRRHKVGTPHPRPPYHVRCRTRQIPVMATLALAKRPFVRAFQPVGQIPKAKRPADMIGQVPASTTFGDWFAKQSAGFQREWLGPTRYALYSKGGYTIDRFVDPLGKELTIEQLRARDAATFKELFGT